METVMAPHASSFCSRFPSRWRRLPWAAGSRTATVRTYAKRAKRTQQQGKGFGKPSPAQEQRAAADSVLAAEEAASAPVAVPPLPPQEAAAPGQPAVRAAVQEAQTQPSSTAALPAVSRGQVLAACAKVSGIIAAVGLALRAAAPFISPAVADGNEESVRALLEWPGGMTAAQLGLSLAVAAAVTAARTALLQVWSDFKDATDCSNRQALMPLQPLDLLWVAALPGISEELLFRGALVPAVYPDWRGVVVAGVVFGALHNNGGRNPAFAAWAAAVGCAYGWLLLATQSVYSPMLAHSVANLASAALWLSDASSGGGSTQQPGAER